MSTPSFDDLEEVASRWDTQSQATSTVQDPPPLDTRFSRPAAAPASPNANRRARRAAPAAAASPSPLAGMYDASAPLDAPFSSPAAAPASPDANRRARRAAPAAAAASPLAGMYGADGGGSPAAGIARELDVQEASPQSAEQAEGSQQDEGGGFIDPSATKKAKKAKQKYNQQVNAEWQVYYLARYTEKIKTT